MNDDAPPPLLPRRPPPDTRSARWRRRAISATRIASLHPDPDRVEIGLTELLVNAVEHGNLGITYEEKASLLERGGFDAEIARRLALPSLAARKVEVTISRNAVALAIRIQDEGDGFDWLPYLDVDPERALTYNGNGIAIAREMSFDDLTLRGPRQRGRGHGAPRPSRRTWIPPPRINAPRGGRAASHLP